MNICKKTLKFYRLLYLRPSHLFHLSLSPPASGGGARGGSGRCRSLRWRWRRPRCRACRHARALGRCPRLGAMRAATAYEVTSWAIAVAQPLYVTRCCRCPGGSGPSPSSRSRPPSCSASAGSSSHGGLDTLARRSLRSVSRRQHGRAGAATHHPSRCHRRRAPHGPAAERRRPPCSALEPSRPRRQIRRRHGLPRRFLTREALSRSAKLPRPSPRLSRAGVTSLLPDSVAARETEELSAEQIRHRHRDSGRFLWHRAPLRPCRATPQSSRLVDPGAARRQSCRGHHHRRTRPGRYGGPLDAATLHAAAWPHARRERV